MQVECFSNVRLEFLVRLLTWRRNQLFNALYEGAVKRRNWNKACTA